MDRMLQKLEIKLEITNVNITLKMEKPSRIGASLELNIDKLTLTKFKTVSNMLLYSFKLSLNKFKINLTLPKYEKSEKVFCLQRIVKDHNDS